MSKKSENIEELSAIIANVNDCYEYYKNGTALDKISPILKKSASDLLRIDDRIEKERIKKERAEQESLRTKKGAKKDKPTYILAKYLRKGKRLNTLKLAQGLLKSYKE